ncbi:WD repeat-containing 44 [Olea europaea subsp. europaea]|uniref:WD repeat-containing 44 n=1 Tax=Olea europaea subsp. europaea TaxID=158383 RepID=A0A8S0U1I0_OLEEU|nr:WD repeat-containing 44 [Olea europaea subsp. europaea]
MPIVDEREEVFFDTLNYLSSEESVVVGKNLVCHDIGYEIWLSAPRSVKERRENFLHRMGFGDRASLGEPEVMGLERVMESSGAASSSCVLSTCSTGDNTECDRRELIGETNCSVDDSDHDWLDMTIDVERQINENYLSVEKCVNGEIQACIEDCRYVDKKRKKMIRWWKRFTKTMRKSRGTKVSKELKLGTKAGNATWVKMEQNKKQCMECSSVYVGQEISAHHGLIWTMKFSPDGQYLASGGEDGVVCIWRVSSIDASCNNAECKFGCQDMEGPSSSQRKKSSHPSVIIPERIFHIEEEPLHMFHGHTSDILDLAWSTTNHLLSSSMDKTVRLWQVGSDECLGIFHHSNYVTCVQFNPGDENYFISGSIDGKVRIFGVTKKRVVHWANARDVVTAICYKPDGKGFVVGSLSGTCRFYETSGDELELKAEINIQGRKKSSDNKITGIQFLKNDSQRVMITSEDSKIRIIDGLEVVHKYRGLAKSGSQMSASFTSSGRHIISVGEDSRIYLWNYDDLSIQTSKQAKSICSCEHLFFDGVSVALPWSNLATERSSFACGNSQSDIQTLDHQEVSSRFQDSEHFSLANWLSTDGSSRASTTWPEEILPSWELQSVENDCQPCRNCSDHLHQQLQHKNNSHGSRILSATWGLVIVAAGSDGMIRTFNNYGLPARI